MKTIVRIAILIVAVDNVGAAGGPSRAAHATGNSGLVIVPFAVPVAVPVAVVRQPGLLYSYRGYASTLNTITASQAAAPPAATPSATVPDTAAAVLLRHCAACHRGAAAQGQLAMFDEAGLIARLPRRRILAAVESGRMPLPASLPRLSPAEMETLRAWAAPPLELVY